MDQSYHLFILLTTTLFTDGKPTEDFAHNWFTAQGFCLGQGLTIEKDKSDKPYWTGVYRRLTPWIKILGCYSVSLDLNVLPTVIKKSMKKRSVGMCQEMCYQEKMNLFAIKNKNCICIRGVEHIAAFCVRAPSNCNLRCVDNPIGDCGGSNTYNIFEFESVAFDSMVPLSVAVDSMGTCLSLQCSSGDTRFIPQQCSESLEKICENKELPDESNASNWTISVEQCKQSTLSYYLLGDVNLTNPHDECIIINHKSDVFWLGVARQTYTSIDQGWKIQTEEKDSFLECQFCLQNDCSFKYCSESLDGFIFCKNMSDTSQSQISTIVTTSHESFSALTCMSNHSTTKQPLVSDSTTGHYDKDQPASTASDELALKISLPVILVFIIILLCALAVLFYARRRKMTKADRTSKVQVESEPRKTIDSDVDYVQNNSYFVLEQCSQYVSKGSNSSNESPYNNSEEGVYDHLRDKKSRKTEVEDTYQHASAGVSRDMSEYDTMANAINKTQEEDTSYDYSHQDSNENYACDLRAKNHLTDDPYDVAV